MPRFARIHVTGGLFHLISRFHDRRFYLDIEGAREKYLELLGKAAVTLDCRIIAYCLMSSHIHLVLQLGNDPIGLLGKKVHSAFGFWVNAQRGGVGSVMADRPKTVLVHSDTYGMEIIRYVHNNPVRAGVVERASDSGWSSHRAYLGLDPCPSWLSTEAVFGPNKNEHETIRKELAQYVDEGRTEGRRPEFSGEVSRELTSRLRKLLGGDVELSYPVLGPDDFVVSSVREQVQRHRQRIIGEKIGVEEVISVVFEALGLDPSLARKRVKPTVVSKGRALAAWFWVEKLGRPQVSIAEGMLVRPTAVCGMLTKLRREGLTDSDNRIINVVFNRLTEEENPTSEEQQIQENIHPQGKGANILILKRKR